MAKTASYEEYRKTRQIHQDVINTIMDFANKNNINPDVILRYMEVQRKLNDIPDFVFDLDLDTDFDSQIFGDLIIYPQVKAVQSLSEFYLANRRFRKIERIEMVQAMVQSRLEPYEVIDRDDELFLTTIKNLITNEELTINDEHLGANNRGKDNIYFLRIIHFENCYFSSGISFTFFNNQRVQRWLKRNHLLLIDKEQASLLLHVYDFYKKFGVHTNNAYSAKREPNRNMAQPENFAVGDLDTGKIIYGNAMNKVVDYVVNHHITCDDIVNLLNEKDELRDYRQAIVDLDLTKDLEFYTFMDLVGCKHLNDYPCVIEKLLEDKQYESLEEKLMMEGILESRIGVYEVTYRDDASCIVTLSNFITKEEIKVNDHHLGLNGNADNMLLVGRIVPYRNIKLTAGWLYPFKRSVTVKNWIKRNRDRFLSDEQGSLLLLAYDFYLKYGSDLLLV